MKTKWLKGALRNFHAAVDYIGQDNPVAAEAVAQRIQEAVSHLARHPNMGRVGLLAETRELGIADLPFIIRYRIRGECIEILRIHHTAQLWPDDSIK